MAARFTNRFSRAQKMMGEANLDLLLILNRENLIYFTGVTQIECLAVLIPRTGEPCAIALWLDAGYVGKESGLPCHGYLFPKETLVAKIIERIHAYGLSKPRIGFERYFVDFAVYDGLRQVFSRNCLKALSQIFAVSLTIFATGLGYLVTRLRLIKRRNNHSEPG